MSLDADRPLAPPITSAMNSADSAPSPTAEESEAVRVLLAAIDTNDAEIEWRSQSTTSRTYDADLRFFNGASVAVEITSSDGGMRNLASVHNKFYETEATNNAWTIVLSPHSADGLADLTSQDVRTIVNEIAPLLGAIEREYQEGVDPRLYDPAFYDGLFQAEIRPPTSLRINIAASTRSDYDNPAGVTTLLRPTASLILDNTDILANRVQEAIDKKHERQQGATWLVVHMRDYGGAAEQLRDLQTTKRDHPNRTSYLNRIDLKSFDKVFVYARNRNNYAVLSIARSIGWSLTAVDE